MLEIAVVSVRENRTVFSIIDEPVLFRKLLKWTKAGIQEAQAAALALEEAKKKVP